MSSSSPSNSSSGDFLGREGHNVELASWGPFTIHTPARKRGIVAGAATYTTGGSRAGVMPSLISRGTPPAGDQSQCQNGTMTLATCII